MSKEYILQYIRDLKSVIDYHVASEFHKNRLFFFSIFVHAFILEDWQYFLVLIKQM